VGMADASSTGSQRRMAQITGRRDLGTWPGFRRWNCGSRRCPARQYSLAATGAGIFGDQDRFAVSPGPLMVPVFAVLAHRLATRLPIGWIVAAGCALFGAGGIIVSLSLTQAPAYATFILPGWLIGG